MYPSPKARRVELRYLRQRRLLPCHQISGAQNKAARLFSNFPVIVLFPGWTLSRRSSVCRQNHMGPNLLTLLTRSARYHLVFQPQGFCLLSGCHPSPVAFGTLEPADGSV